MDAGDRECHPRDVRGQESNARERRRHDRLLVELDPSQYRVLVTSMTMPAGLRRLSVAIAMALAVCAPAFAQTSDDLFNPEVLQRVELWLNEADWAKL